MSEGKVICGIYEDMNVERKERAERELEVWAFEGYEEMMQTKIEDASHGPWIPYAPARAAYDLDSIRFDPYSADEEIEFAHEEERDA